METANQLHTIKSNNHLSKKPEGDSWKFMHKVYESIVILKSLYANAPEDNFDNEDVITDSIYLLRTAKKKINGALKELTIQSDHLYSLKKMVVTMETIKNKFNGVNTFNTNQEKELLFNLNKIERIVSTAIGEDTFKQSNKFFLNVYDALVIVKSIYNQTNDLEFTSKNDVLLDLQHLIDISVGKLLAAKSEVRKQHSLNIYSA